MKELRCRVVFPHHRAELRVLYAFDPRRNAVLLIGGDKTGKPGWYEKYVPVADRLFDDQLQQIEREDKKRGQKI